MLMICNYAPRYQEAIPQSMQQKFFSRVSIPQEILSDLGTNLMLKKIYQLLYIHPIQMTPYKFVVRFNKMLKALLRKVIKEEEQDWNTLLPTQIQKDTCKHTPAI